MNRHADLNVKFANAWRVSNKTSLFDYAPGMGTEDFTNKAWPVENATNCNIPNQPLVVPIEKEVAERLCADIANKAERANCAVDVALTGEPNFARTYALSEELEQRATETEVFPERTASRAGERVDFVAVVKHKKTGERIAPAGSRETGAVQFTLNGSRLGKPVKVDAFGRATLTTSRLKPGKHQIGAMYVPAKAEAGFLPSVSVETQHHVVAKEGR
jgi:hypothetical protein